MNYYPQPFPSMNNGAGYPYPASSYPLGYGGYMGGYYTGNYAAYNPYEIQRQQQEAARKQQQQVKEQQDLLASMYRASCKGNKPNQEVIDGIYGRTKPKKIPGLDDAQQSVYEGKVAYEQQMAANNYYIDNICHNSTSLVNNQQQLDANMAKMQEQHKGIEEMGMYEYFNSEIAQQDMARATENERLAYQANLAALYNQNQYSQFLDQFHMRGININTDDLTISLPNPSSLAEMNSEEERRQRRLAFLRQIGLKS
jgi:hypothetical protein